MPSFFRSGTSVQVSDEYTGDACTPPCKNWTTKSLFLSIESISRQLQREDRVMDAQIKSHQHRRQPSKTW